MKKIAVQVGRTDLRTRDHPFSFVVVQYVADHLQRYEEYIHPYKSGQSRGFKRFRRQCRLLSQARTGVSLVLFYLFIKILYILNLILQICFLQYFLSYHDVNYIRYGAEVLAHLFSGFSLPESRLFPRITLCDFQIRELGERHQYTVECILVINIFIEKMYFVLWLWFWILLAITLIDTIKFIYRIFPPHSRSRFIEHHLDLIVRNRISREKHFRTHLRLFPIDNVFALWIVASNANTIIVAEILDEFFFRKSQDGSDV